MDLATTVLCIFSVILPIAADNTILETAVSLPKCLTSIDRYTCMTGHAQGLIDTILPCKPDYLQFIESQAAQCTTRHNNTSLYCYHAFSGLNISQSRACSSIMNSSCTPACRQFLMDTVNDGGCCVDTVFNSRFSRLVLGFDIRVAFKACHIQLPKACQTPFNIATPTTAAQYTYPEFWGKVVNYLCSRSVGQPYVNAITTDPDCVPIARHYTMYCGIANNHFCLDILQGSFPLMNPIQSAFTNPFLKNVTVQCANYTTFVNTCPKTCQSAIQAAISKFHCCINMFNDSVNQILLPHISGNVMIACGLPSPGQCKSVLQLTISNGTASTTAGIIYLFLALLTLGEKAAFGRLHP